MASATQQAFESIRIVGGLLGTKILHDVRQFSLPGQDRQAYGVEPGLTFNDEIGRYWIIARGRWREFQQKSQREDITTKSVTVNDWLIPLLTRVLGYEITPCQQKKMIGEREFPISHESFSGGVPIVLCGSDIDLDTSDSQFGQEGRKRSPMGLAQEYLNAQDDSLWAIVSNGQVLRLLRDNPAMTRPAYLEVDFARLFEEDNYADFATLWLLLHSSRLAPQENLPEHCWLEQWREKGHDEGERALDKLRYGVADALRQLGTGFLAHPANTDLRHKLSANELSTDAYFQQVLRLVYRFLFLLTAEDRSIALLPVNHEGQDYRSARALYETGYSISTLRDKARQRRHYDHHTDAWDLLGVTFDGYANGQPLLAQPALGGLFAPDQCEDLSNSQIENRYLYSALFNLCYFEHKGILARINYRDMDTEEFGSVYESLLELIPQLHTEGQWRFSFIGDAEDEAAASGHSRKLTGSYYTPDSLVQELIKSALEPVIQDRLEANPQNPREALLGITVCDPACGSGHFLLAAARRLATELAQVDAGSDQATEGHFRHALRDVVRHCIYGVDLNPMAVELCKTGLWLESIEPGKPLSFLDAHIQCGNALVGVLDTKQLEQGIPADAFKALSGDDKKVCTDLKKQNTQAGKKLAISLRMIPQTFNEMESMPEDTVEQVEAKRKAFAQAQAGQSYQNDRLKEDLFTAAFFAPKTSETASQVPTNSHLRLIAEGQPLPEPVLEITRELASMHRFFHWPMAFPQVFGDGAKGGFDVMLGNPPWDVSQMNETEYFANRAPWVAGLAGAKRKAEIEDLQSKYPALFERYITDRKTIEGQNQFARIAGRNKLTAKGKLNLYALFSELFANAISVNGRAGVIVPTGIATDDSKKDFFTHLNQTKKILSFTCFDNQLRIFPSVHPDTPFGLLTLGNNPSGLVGFCFYLLKVEDIHDINRNFTLASEDYELINPNTKTCPVFRAQKDAEITKKIYRSAPVLIREAEKEQPEINSWGVRFSQGLFNMTSASHLFINSEDFESHSEPESLLPLYEAKMVHHYDHRWATYEIDGETSRDCTLEEKQNPNYQPRPRYWVPENEVTLRTAKAPKAVLDACKKEDTKALKEALTSWLAGSYLSQSDKHSALNLLSENAHDSDDLFDAGIDEKARTSLSMHEQYPLGFSEQNVLETMLSEEENPWSSTWMLLNRRRPGYLIGWRDITNATNERTVIAGVIPLSAVGDTFLLMFPKVERRDLIACLLADQCSLPHDFIARQKVGGTHLKYNIKRQIVTLPPGAYSDDNIAFIRNRVLELVYTAYDLKPFAADLGYTGEPFRFDPPRRHQLQCELDAYYAKLYGLTRDELRYILDPSDLMGDEYPSETFRVLKKNEIREFGEYRTQRLVLEAWDKLEAGELQ
ncbi:N-6 DNA methylase [Marinobacter salarius]|uniref:Eco57I restriction-modification methylase domain-containing protein n=1 Tax=Marinobacter salarius TaxID=1420917 RepID=UPI00273BB659|nr:N-6 DNA methylase [Marinobacter salarius]MDP4533492.1 N-6 DNA methylase [Marinobacter salarius]